eukprot:364935-Chlamydomonas_euryale.AAC.18
MYFPEVTRPITHVTAHHTYGVPPGCNKAHHTRDSPSHMLLPITHIVCLLDVTRLRDGGMQSSGLPQPSASSPGKMWGLGAAQGVLLFFSSFGLRGDGGSDNASLAFSLSLQRRLMQPSMRH